MSFKEKLIMTALEDLIPDMPTVAPTKPEAIKVKAVLQEMTAFMDLGDMGQIVSKVSNIVILTIEKSPEQQEKARHLLEKIKAVIS